MPVDHWPCAKTHSSALLVLIHLTFMTIQCHVGSYDLHVTDKLLTFGRTEKLGNLQLYHRVAGSSLCCLPTCVCVCVCEGERDSLPFEYIILGLRIKGGGGGRRKDKLVGAAGSCSKLLVRKYGLLRALWLGGDKIPLAEWPSSFGLWAPMIICVPGYMTLMVTWLKVI